MGSPVGSEAVEQSLNAAVPLAQFDAVYELPRACTEVIGFQVGVQISWDYSDLQVKEEKMTALEGGLYGMIPF